MVTLRTMSDTCKWLDDQHIVNIEGNGNWKIIKTLIYND